MCAGMRILLSWLQEFVDWNGSIDELETLLVNNGIEVEAVEHIGISDSAVVTAQVLEVEPHPSAERLRVCTVFDGTSTRRVVCGAPNIAKGMLVAFAPAGAKIAANTTVEKRVIRGIESEGMICSEHELGLGDDHTGIMVLDGSLEVGMPLSTLYPRDVVLTIGITPNRGDALSHYGIARIVAAFHGLSAHLPSINDIERFPIPIEIELPTPTLCWRYAACVLDNVDVIPSPRWLARRLEHAGLRPRNVVVDVTNYVMLECGQPLHAFDFDSIEDGHIVVRCAQENERLTTLDGVERELHPSILCICDSRKPLAIAGIMGGANSAISDSTRRVLLESAYFAPAAIRRASKLLGLQTDASYRFERGVDIEMIPYALNRAATLIAELTGARVSETVDRYPTKWEPPQIDFRLRRAAQLLGISLDPVTTASALASRGFTITRRDDEVMTVEPPSYRSDVRSDIDLVEEVAIAIGYDTIQPSQHAIVPFAALQIPKPLSVQIQRNQIRQMLASLGFHETLTYNLHDPDTVQDLEKAVEVANALGRERSVLRQWLIPSAVEVISHNVRYGAKSIRIFEIGKVFSAQASAHHAVTEREHLVLAIAGIHHDRHWLEPVRRVDFYDLKGIVTELVNRLASCCQWREPGSISPVSNWFEQSFYEIVVEGKPIGYAGQLHHRIIRQYDLPEAVFIAEIALDLLYDLPRSMPRYVAPSPYPAVVRDIALVVPKATTSEAIADTIRNAAGEFLKSVEPFDVYEHPSLGEDKKSIAFGLTFVSPDRTLTDEEVNAAIERALDAVRQQYHAQLRML